jgi:hypothetical protein
MTQPTLRRSAAAMVLAALLAALAASTALAHEDREVAGYELEVGFIDEPVYAGQKSGLELGVTRDEQPVEGLEETLAAEVIYGERTMALPLSPRFGEPGWYESVFFPTAAGPYTFHISGLIEGTAIDERFTSSKEGFDEVNEATAGQFPVQYPAMADLVANAQRGADAAGQLPVALGLGAAAVVLGLVALGVALAGRRRAA